MTDGPQQPDEHPGTGEEFTPQPGRPAFPAATPPSGYGFPQQPPQPQQSGGYGFPQQPPQPQQSGGYGFPQQPPQPQQSGGYGFPQQPAPHAGGEAFPPWNPEPEPPAPARAGAAEPDWAALADANAEGGKRRKLYVIGGTALAVVVVGAIVTAGVLSGGPATPKPRPTSTATNPALPTPSPSFSDVTPTAPPSPSVVLADPELDTAPLTASGLFAGATVRFPADAAAHLPARGYSKTNVYGTTACSSGGGGTLAGLLAREGCEKMLRATYRRGDTAVTVGVAVFPSVTKAKAAMDGMDQHGYLQPLAGGSVGHAFCHLTGCQSAVRTLGRYAYFTLSGRVDGTPVTTTDPNSRSAADDIATMTFRLLLNRGAAEATAR